MESRLDVLRAAPGSLGPETEEIRRRAASSVLSYPIATRARASSTLVPEDAVSDVRPAGIE